MPVRVTVRGSESLERKFRQLSEAAQGKMLERALVAGGLIVQNAAKQAAPFRTGNLRRSIHIGGHDDLATDRQGITDRTNAQVPDPEIGRTDAAIYIGTDVVYARRLEYGFTGRDARGRAFNQTARPYLRPAIDENGAEIRQEVAEAFRDLLRAALR